MNIEDYPKVLKYNLKTDNFEVEITHLCKTKKHIYYLTLKDVTKKVIYECGVFPDGIIEVSNKEKLSKHKVEELIPAMIKGIENILKKEEEIKY